jgi:hypothetical protein
VGRALRFLAAQAQPPAGKRPRLDPAVRAAFDLWREEPPHRRWRAEALLLTAEPVAEVARRCALSATALEAYHALFFAVRRHLAATDWVLAQAIGACPYLGFAGQPLGCLWKYAAFTGGPYVVEAVIAISTGQPLPPWLRATLAGADAAYTEARVRLLGRLVVGALTASSPAELAPLVAARERLRRLDRAVMPEGAGTPGVLSAMEQFLTSVVGRGRRRPRQHTRPPSPSRRRAARAGTSRQPAPPVHVQG